MALDETLPPNGISPLHCPNPLRAELTRGGAFSSGSVILIVDASIARQRSIASALQGLGHEIVEAKSTSDAFYVLAERPVDLIIADLCARGCGGVALCQQLKASLSTQLLPVLLMARGTDMESEVSAIDAGADALIPVPIKPRLLRSRVQASLQRKLVTDSLDETETVLFTLAQSVEGRDSALGAHCERLALMAATMGLTLGLTSDDILALQRGGYLHDVGKVAIPDSVLFKPGPLTPEEWVIMQSHAERGERICSRVRSLAPVLPIIRHHHEKWDGTGYPDGLKGEQIPLLARIFQLADIYDALTAIRPYKRAFTPEEAIQIMREEAARGWRDPGLVATFADLLPLLAAAEIPDSIQLSLHALANSLDRYRTTPARKEMREVFATGQPVKMVSGL